MDNQNQCCWNRIEWNLDKNMNKNMNEYGYEYEYEQKSNLKLSMTYNQIGELEIAK